MTIDKKVLVVDDKFYWNFEHLVGRFVDAPGSLAEAEKFLRAREYHAILMDEFLDESGILWENPLRTNGSELLERIRGNYYGEKNLATPIYSISTGSFVRGASEPCLKEPIIKKEEFRTKEFYRLDKTKPNTIVLWFKEQGYDLVSPELLQLFKENHYDSTGLEEEK